MRAGSAAFLFAFLAQSLLAQEELGPGLTAVYESLDSGVRFRRVDRRLGFDWRDGRPDPRLPEGRFRVLWSGQLFVQAAGEYRFFAYLSGSIQLWLEDRPVLVGARSEPGWVRGAAVRLRPGFVPLKAVYVASEAEPLIQVAWESEQLLLEPLPPRHLFHRPEEALRLAERRFRTGEQLVRAYRCAACHRLPGADRPLAAPALDHSLAGVGINWVQAWLGDPKAVRADARMPALGMDPQEAGAVAAFLHARQQTADFGSGSKGGNAGRGRQLFALRGCAACHRAEGVGHNGLFGGGSLDGIGSKRLAAALLRWLQNPAAVNPDHRMPKMSLPPDDLPHLVAYLRSLRTKLPAPSRQQPDHALAARLIEHFRCAACHRLEGFSTPPKLPAPAAQQDGCLGDPDPTAGRPGFRFGRSEREAIRSYLQQTRLAGGSMLARSERGRRVWEENNCQACHRRYGEGGYAEVLDPQTVQALGISEHARRGELVPPDLTAVGDKFHRAVLRRIVTGEGLRRRPWLQLRMPTFPVDRDAFDALATYLEAADRLFEPLPSSRLAERAAELDATPLQQAVPAARLLVTARGFGCMSCHIVGGRRPPGADPEARGPEVVGLPKLVRRSWFVRWISEPSRIATAVEMPGVQLAVPGVLAGKLKRQLSALWRAFGQAEFHPPDQVGTPVQIVSPRQEGRTVVLRDCMRNAPAGSGWCARALAIGFPTAVNVLLDLDTFAVRALWVGDLAVELTERKTWLWEPAGLQLWERTPRVASVAVERDAEVVLPAQRWQSVGRLRYWEHVDDAGIELGYDLFLPDGMQLPLRDHWQTYRQGKQVRLTRTLSAPRGDVVPCVVVDAALVHSHSATQLTIPTPLGPLTVRSMGEPWRLNQTSRGRVFTSRFRPTERSVQARLEYVLPPFEAELIARSLPAPQPTHRPERPEELPWVPGYRTIRLPLDDSVLPTTIGFLPGKGTLVGSLRGGVFLAVDRDGDGYEDRWERYADYLAAPFGMLVEGDSVVVAHKPELVRLRDPDDDGFAERVDVIATGWGYTHDYHDWTFGVVKDRSGAYVITLGSDYQQRGRPKQASRYRGKALRVKPDGSIEVLARGLRFPTGVAANRDGDIFFTDNQGEQNTFNELNHLLPGSRYGVPSLYDPPPRDDPWPERQPAIQIPHPWTRSVNGICFLDSVARRFGPHEGHGIGCEYDTRRLIRFTLYRSGSSYRGACYPLSLDPRRDRERLMRWWRRLVAANRPVAVAPPERLAPLGPVSCAVRPDGVLYVGSLRESGWGAGNNVGELLRVEPTGAPPAGIRSVRFDGSRLIVTFTCQVRPERASRPEAYRISSYRRIWRGTYATPDSDRRHEQPIRVAVRADRRQVTLELSEVRPGYVYEVYVDPGLFGVPEPWPTEAYVTAP